MYSVFLSSYRNTRESLGELEKPVETLPYGSRSHSITSACFVLFALDFYEVIVDSAEDFK